MDSQRVFLYGAGGHGRSVLEVLFRARERRVVAIVDDGRASGDSMRDVPIVGGADALEGLLADGVRAGVVAIGDNAVRERIADLLVGQGIELTSVVDPSAVVASDATVGAGTAVMPTAVIGAGVVIGRCVILNTGSSVDHDCRVGDFAHLSPGVRVSGGCTIRDGCHVGIGASIAQLATVGRAAVIGAGAAVIGDVPPGTTFVGVPARERAPRAL
jgi:sugar O-acyltransferase (sialic acid O-acetyltransferase NeuD family)